LTKKLVLLNSQPPSYFHHSANSTSDGMMNAVENKTNIFSLEYKEFAEWRP
jgi:hypothetical protein